MEQKSCWGVLVIVATVVFPVPLRAVEPASAAPPVAGHPAQGISGMELLGGPEAHEMHFGYGLDLTPEQERAIQDVRAAYRPRWKELRARGESIRAQLTALSPDEADYATASQVASQNAATLAADVVLLASQMRADLHALLTAEQRAQLHQQMQERRQRWETWRSRWRATP